MSQWRGNGRPSSHKTGTPLARASLTRLCRLAAMHSWDSEKTPLLSGHCQHAPAAPCSSSSQSRLDRARRSAFKLVGIAALAAFAISTLLQGGKHDAGVIPLSSSNVPWKTDPFNPTSLALAVRSPYLNVWLEGGNRARQGLLTSQYGDSRTSEYSFSCLSNASLQQLPLSTETGCHGSSESS
jgi:hypothetical protein